MCLTKTFLVFYILYKILTTFKLAVIAPAIVVTCPAPNGPFCNTNVEFALVTLTSNVLEIAGSNTTVDVVTFSIKLLLLVFRLIVILQTPFHSHQLHPLENNNLLNIFLAWIP